MPRDELAEALWGSAPPATWDKALTVIASMQWLEDRLELVERLIERKRKRRLRGRGRA